MAQHEAKHRGEANNNNQDSDKPVADALGLGMGASMGTPLRESKLRLFCQVLTRPSCLLPLAM